MFSGIIEEMGSVHQLTRSGQAIRMIISAAKVTEGLSEGESIAVNGACLTALDIQPDHFAVDISPETARVTNLGALKAGEAVNLERAMRLSDRLNGHLVSGHIDGIGLICAKRDEENAVILSVEAPAEILRHTIQKGSITIDGVSMTVNGLTERTLTVSMIPHTARVTTLGKKGVGTSVNLESDLIGKYVEKLLGTP
ncbi:MAG TPA: riboflavin synthase [Nitrospiria bacterium]|nr:riboflavin synthase [Candidatus Manganitrophaceae bacterium]HIL35314.1 riboflavin synthase [Candidatus Manganitrophaceae bacterium]